MINGFNCGIWQGRAGLTEVWQMMKIITAFSKKNMIISFDTLKNQIF